jgi:hypothetical protein
MPGRRITTTRALDLVPQRTAGQSAVDNWHQLHSLLETALSPAHAALFAEPVLNPASGETDWYADRDEPVAPLGSLPASGERSARQALYRLIQDVSDLAARLRSSNSSQDRFRADILDLACMFPGDGYIYEQGGQPVLVAWGHAAVGARPEPVILWGVRPSEPAPMAILPPPGLPVRRARYQWLWSLSALMLLLLLAGTWLAIQDPFGWFTPALLVCRVAPDQGALLAALRDARDRQTELRHLLGTLMTDGGARRLQCAPVPTDPERARTHGAKSGKLEVILAWDDKNDLDLYVVCPDGIKVIYHENKGKEVCGGKLDVDANHPLDNAVSDPAEHVTFANPSDGAYRVTVKLWGCHPTDSACSSGNPVRFRVTVLQQGKSERQIAGTVSKEQPVQDVGTVVVE